MRKMLLFLMVVVLLTAQAEEINSPLVHAEEMPLAVDISPVITFLTDETGVFAVVTLASSDELPSQSPVPSLAPSVEPEILGEGETEEPASFLVTTHSTPHSITYTFTPMTPEQGESP